MCINRELLKLRLLLIANNPKFDADKAIDQGFVHLFLPGYDKNDNKIQQSEVLNEKCKTKDDSNI